MATINAKKLNILSNLSRNRGQFFGLAAVLLAFFIFTGQAQANGLPAPTLLVPALGTRLGQDRVWVGGVAFNGSAITILVDDHKIAQAKTRNHKSGVGSFGVELVNLGLGSHKITSLSRDNKGRTSIISNILTINIEPKTPAPTLYKPVVNSDSGIERPFIVGNIQAGLEVRIVVDDRIVADISPKSSQSRVTSFAWQPETALSLGQHKIEAFASDKGKLSNNSAPIYWPVGKVSSESGDKVSQNKPVPAAGGDDSGLSVIESKPGSESLTVTDKSKKSQEKPIIPEKPKEPETLVAPEPPQAPEVPAKVEPVAKDEGKIFTGEDANKEIAVNDKGEKIQETAPGAAVKQIVSNEGAGFELNNSLIVGLAILVFLLLSMAVWYVQERKEKLGEKVVSMFKEPDVAPGSNPESSRDRGDLPPPPPPVF